MFSVIPARATPITYVAQLSGPAESPPNSSLGTGTAVVTLDVAAHTLFVDVTFSGLSGTTTASHIHCCTGIPGTGTAGVATVTPSFTNFPLGVTFGTYMHTFNTLDATSYNPAFVTAEGGSAAAAEAALAAGLAADEAYLNIHTTVVPGGEIRGFLVPAPEPSTLAVVVVGLTGLMWGRRRIHSAT
jgi:hypothetical protein